MPNDKTTTTEISLGSMIRRLREKKFPGHGGITLAAEKFGIGRNNWSDWEAGRRTPSDANQRKLAEFFGVKLVELRGDESPSVAHIAPQNEANPSSQRDETIKALKDHIAMAESVANDYRGFWKDEQDRRQAAEDRNKELERQVREMATKIEQLLRGKR